MATKKTVRTKAVRVTIAVLAVAAPVMWVSLWILGRLPIGDWLSFGQLGVDLLLIPAAFYGLRLAQKELQSMMESPKLDLDWGADGKELRQQIPQGSEKEHRRLPLAMSNKGDAVAV